MLAKHLNKENLHHAYLLEGDREVLSREVMSFLSENFSKKDKPELVNIVLDTIKVDDARNIKSHALERASGASKRFFIISANSILLEAQNSLLKVFEEPILDTHFFVIVPEASVLLDTVVSRFYFISYKTESSYDSRESENFIKMSLPARLEFIKGLLMEEEEEGDDIGVGSSPRSKSLNFLNSLEQTLHTNPPKTAFDSAIFHKIFTVREFLRMPGSSPKTLLESIALTLPSR